MFDNYLLRFIKEFLQKCDNCEKYDIFKEIQFCCYCHKYNCSSCKMVRDYTHYETCGFYCEKCHKDSFV